MQPKKDIFYKQCHPAYDASLNSFKTKKQIKISPKTYGTGVHNMTITHNYMFSLPKKNQASQFHNLGGAIKATWMRPRTIQLRRSFWPHPGSVSCWFTIQHMICSIKFFPSFPYRKHSVTMECRAMAGSANYSFNRLFTRECYRISNNCAIYWCSN